MYFILRGGGGQRVLMAEDYRLVDRDPQAKLEALVSKMGSMDTYEFRNATSRARAKTDEPVSVREARMAEEVNQALDRAFRAWLDNSPGAAASAVEDALRAAQRYEFRLEEVVDRVRVRPQRFPQPDSFRIVGEEAAVVGGAPALRIDYEYHEPDYDPHVGRDLYFVQGRSLFVASFVGLKRNLALFDRIVASVTLPAAAPDEAPRP